MKQPKIRASSIKSVNPEPTRENRDIVTQLTRWVPFFKDTKNIYVNDLALRYRRSATTAAIINAKVNYASGSEFLYYINEKAVEYKQLDESFKLFVDNANNDMQSLEDVFKDICFNWITFGNVYIEVSRAKIKGTNRFATNLFVHDSTKVRIDKNLTKAYISSHWRDIELNVHSAQYPKPKEVELWNRNENTTQQNYIVHVKRRVPEYDYYGLPDYVATLKDADIEYHVDTYNLKRLENGFFPASIVSLFGEPPEGYTDAQYINKLNEKYTGSDKAGQPLFQLLDDPAQAAQVQEFSGEKDGEFRFLEESAKKGIIEGHRWFPALAGIETSGKLGSNQEIINQWRVAMGSVVIPDYQQPMIRVINKLIKMSGYPYYIEVLNEPPVGIEDKIDVKLVLTVDEQREILGYAPNKELNGKDDSDNNS